MYSNFFAWQICPLSKPSKTLSRASKNLSLSPPRNEQNPKETWELYNGIFSAAFFFFYGSRYLHVYLEPNARCYAYPFFHSTRALQTGIFFNCFSPVTDSDVASTTCNKLRNTLYDVYTSVYDVSTCTRMHV
jgi:hypothetical protein